MLTALVILLVLIAILAAAPPVSKDALVHHLAVPKIYLRHGGMVELPSMPFSYYPANLELLYWGALALGNDILPKYIHFAFALMTAWLLYRYLKSKLSVTYGVLGALFFLSIPIIVKLSTTVYIDLGVIFFTFASILFLFEWLEKGMQLRYLAVSALFCGLAVGTKYNGLIALFLLTLSVPFLYMRVGPAVRGRSARAIGLGAGYFLAAVLVCSPWLVRNYQWTGNPLHPLYKQWFTGSGASGNGGLEEALAKRAAPQKVGHGMFTYRRVVYGESGWEIALLPVRVFFQGEDGNPRFFDGKLHPFLLILPLFAFIRSREGPDPERRQKVYLLAFAVLFFAFALFSRTLRIRYIAPMIPPLVVLSVFGVRNLLDWIGSLESRPVRRVARLAFFAAMAVLAAYSLDYFLHQYREVQPWAYLSGEATRDAYISDRRSEYPVVQYANRNTPEDAKILLAFMGRRGYYLDRDYIPGVARLGHIIRRSGSPESILGNLKKQGVTHLLLFLPIFEKWAGDNLDEAERSVAKGFFERHAEVLCLHKGYALFALEKGYPETSS
jgi:hypothetical protein